MTWNSTANLDTLRLRSQLLARIREFFYENEMLEVQTPVLSRDTVIDRHLDPIQVATGSIDLGNQVSDADLLFLQTSPEFAMKRLLASGLDSIFQICPAFRAGEAGEFHNPEFTMVEWYRCQDNFDTGIDFLGRLVRHAAGWGIPERISYTDAFRSVGAFDPIDASLASIVEYGVAELSVDADWSDDRDDWLNLILSDIIQPKLGVSKPVIVTNYPASQSALARLADDGMTAERFELFFKGVELANGYHELTCSETLRERNHVVNLQRVADGKEPLPEDSQMLKAMDAGLPKCAGCALGFDRLIMLCAGVDSIAEVLTFPIDRC